MLELFSKWTGHSEAFGHYMGEIVRGDIARAKILPIFSPTTPISYLACSNILLASGQC